MPPTDRMTLTEHLEELRRRLGISLIAFLVAVGISWTQVERLIDWLIRPAQPWLPALAFFSLTEPLVAYLQVATLGGMILAMPVLLFQLWAFVRTGLSRQERTWGLAFLGWGSGLFVAGAAFAYTIMLPLSLRVLLQIGQGRLAPVVSIRHYLSFVTATIFWCGLIFELPAILWLLAKAGIVTPEWLRQQRPYATLVLVILAAIMTPTTDIVSLLLMTAPLLVLYEVSLLVTRWAMAPRRR